MILRSLFVFSAFLHLNASTSDTDSSEDCTREGDATALAPEFAAISLLQRKATAVQQSVSSDAVSGSRLAAATEHHARSKTPEAAGWFGDFSLGESTYSVDGTYANRNENSQVNVMEGWNPDERNPFDLSGRRPNFFEETKSGGYKEAWQTFFPDTPEGVPGNRGKTGQWFTAASGAWQQNYRSPDPLDPGLVPSWFDDSVNQVDGFGRDKFPVPDSPRNYLYWEERSVNTTLTCKAANCTANVSLMAPFNSKTEIHKHCKMSIAFHPTDFDDHDSGEEVQWIYVNNMLVSSHCHPHTYGSACNATAPSPLIPCVNDLPIDLLLPSNGVLEIGAKISEAVDECPYQENLLSAVPMVTCLVAPKPTPAPADPMPATSMVQDESCVSTMPLQCPTRGCAGEIHMSVKPSCAARGRCKLSVLVHQTDFDAKDDTPELIEYIKVAGKSVASNLHPGLNPCKADVQGQQIAPSAKIFTALKDYDVTEHARQGSVRIEGKISTYVDECASNGHLFDALATIDCRQHA